MTDMRWKPEVQVLIDPYAPIIRSRRPLFALLEVDGKACGGLIRFTTLRETIRRARAVYHQAGHPREGYEPFVRVLLVPALGPVKQGALRGLVPLRCPQEGCEHLILWAHVDRSGRITTRAKRVHQIRQHRITLPPEMMYPPGATRIWCRCRHCNAAAVWILDPGTSWIRSPIALSSFVPYDTLRDSGVCGNVG